MSPCHIYGNLQLVNPNTAKTSCLLNNHEFLQILHFYIMFESCLATTIWCNTQLNSIVQHLFSPSHTYPSLEGMTKSSKLFGHNLHATQSAVPLNLFSKKPCCCSSFFVLLFSVRMF
ncbi:hypothetical protein SAY87_024037 [Trapa incisa]|uniref:Uncharacterized protein n=1 Tax=Trapa incisa TaxID=236973 RepID=A0AAN7L7F9_9MYRT|nr:hypothetical protein SAY87_024037 [Trapa incisa]